MGQYASKVTPQLVPGSNTPPAHYVQSGPEPELWFQYWVGVIEIAGGIAAIITLVLVGMKWLMKGRPQRQAQPAANHDVELGIVLHRREAHRASRVEERSQPADEGELFDHVREEGTAQRNGGTATRSTTMTYTTNEEAVASLNGSGGTLQHGVQTKDKSDQVEEELQIVSQIDGGATASSASMGSQ